MIKGASRVPGPLRIGVIAYEPVAGPSIALEVRSVEDGRTVTGTARAAADPAYTALRVERTGPHELKLSAGGTRSPCCRSACSSSAAPRVTSSSTAGCSWPRCCWWVACSPGR
ncbi:hypothetical protein [Nonomuraea salmonea]|uniref:hypothetical protein n=1 Tax=Nonomuraea salmonea TaxID=46181 RepID=UPI0031F00BD8